VGGRGGIQVAGPVDCAHGEGVVAVGEGRGGEGAGAGEPATGVKPALEAGQAAAAGIVAGKGEGGRVVSIRVGRRGSQRGVGRRSVGRRR